MRSHRTCLQSRVSARALFGVTTVNRVFVYLDAWPTHLSWAGLLALRVARGAGSVSPDRRLGIR